MRKMGWLLFAIGGTKEEQEGEVRMGNDFGEDFMVISSENADDEESGIHAGENIHVTGYIDGEDWPVIQDEEDWYADEPDEYLEIADDGCENWGCGIDDLVFADEVYVRDNETLRRIIDSAKQENCEKLRIDMQGILEMPAEIGELKNLKSLYIRISGSEGFFRLPPEIGKLKNLEKLEMYDCKLERLPEEFSGLTGLKALNLNDNHFKEFPEEILSLVNLESLAINWDFERVPDEICNLTHLKYLFLPGANITELPENIGNLQELETLSIWGTKVKRLPESCLKLSKLKNLSLTKSVFKDILPPEIAAQSPLEAINYIVRYQKDAEKTEVNESKMIIVGQGGVGKTCLLNRLIKDIYDDTASTEGIGIVPWEFERDGKKYRLNVWDFGGQEIYHATHQFFLTNRSFYIFVWDARQEEEYGRIDYWLHTIESFACQSPIMIVVNKCDSRNSIKQLDLKSMKEKFPQIIDSYKVSCKENWGIGDLRDAIEKETAKLPLMGMVWLSGWLKVRMALETLARDRNMISYTEYRKICREHNILSGEALSLSKYLHDLGIIINFQNDLYLKNIVILNPDWGTNAVYKVLDAQETVLKDRNGILKYGDLHKIWKNTEEYPEEFYPVLLRLMENFQLSFEIRKNEEYLIAELLESEEVSVEWNENDGQALNFQYDYDFLPAGIMTRFIVKANAYLMVEEGKRACWKKGAWLRYEDSIGLVKLFDGITDRRIEIKVTGKNSRNNRDLLVIIRKYFYEIHSSIPKIKYTEYVKCNCQEDCTYRHDYRYLLKLEQKGILEERCRHSLELVDVPKLLDGVNVLRKRRSGGRGNMNHIQVNPHIVVENHNSGSNENSNANSVQNTVMIQIKNSINELQGTINDLKDELVYENPALEKEFEKLERSTEKLNQAQTKEEIIQSGAMNRLKRFLEEIQDTGSELGKAVQCVKYGVGIAQEIGEKYNSIAQWCGLPVIPKIFLKR